jgi:hypothetical protein
VQRSLHVLKVTPPTTTCRAPSSRERNVSRWRLSFFNFCSVGSFFIEISLSENDRQEKTSGPSVTEEMRIPPCT